MKNEIFRNMKNEIFSALKELYDVIIDSIKNDTFIDMCFLWMTLIGLFLCLPILGFALIHAFCVVILPYFLCISIIAIISFIIPLSIRLIYNLFKSKNEKQ